MAALVKRTIHLYELPNYMEGRFFISSYELENPFFPYIGNAEVEFEMPEKQKETKEDKLKKIDKEIEAQKEVLKKLKQERDGVALET